MVKKLNESSRLVRRLHVTHEKRNLREALYTALRFNAGGTADNDDDIRRDTSMYSRADFYVITVIRPGKKRRKRTWSI